MRYGGPRGVAVSYERGTLVVVLDTAWWFQTAPAALVREAPRFGPLSLAPVSAKELKERAFQGVL